MEPRRGLKELRSLRVIRVKTATGQVWRPTRARDDQLSLLKALSVSDPTLNDFMEEDGRSVTVV
jgi:hypothetical protein